jgi:tetratricopeptide (TPR) repeat protein
MSRIQQSSTLLMLLPALAVAGDLERGQEAFLKSDYSLAIACFTAHLKANPQSSDAYLYRGTAYSVQREYDNAIKDFTEAIRLNPRMAQAYHGRATAYLVKRDYDKIIENYSQLIRQGQRALWVSWVDWRPA